jgi:hypothetical protein
LIKLLPPRGSASNHRFIASYKSRSSFDSTGTCFCGPDDRTMFSMSKITALGVGFQHQNPKVCYWGDRGLH